MIKFSDKSVPKNQQKSGTKEIKSGTAANFGPKIRICPSKSGTVSKYAVKILKVPLGRRCGPGGPKPNSRHQCQTTCLPSTLNLANYLTQGVAAKAKVNGLEAGLECGRMGCCGSCRTILCLKNTP